jgi:hypothetical protein
VSDTSGSTTHYIQNVGREPTLCQRAAGLTTFRLHGPGHHYTHDRVLVTCRECLDWLHA